MTELSECFSSEEDLREFIERSIRGIERWISICGDCPASGKRDEAIRYNKKLIEKWQDVYEQRYGRRYAPELRVMRGDGRILEKPNRRMNC
jgi:hypothetical protein